MTQPAPDQIIPSHIRQMPDGRLLLVGGNHNVQAMFAADGPAPSADRVAVFLDNHRQRSAFCAERGIGFSQWVFPDPILFAGGFPAGQMRSAFERALPEGNRPAGMHYPLALLDGYPDRQNRTDTHYSPIGNMHVAARIVQQMQGKDHGERLAGLMAQLAQPHRVAGDLGVQCTPHITEMRAAPPRVPGIRSALTGVQSGNMGIMQLIVSPNADSDRTLLIFGDSFFRMLLPELARYWRRIVFCRTQFFHAEMVAAVAPDDILTGLAERYFASTRPDAERPHFLAYPLMLGRAMAPDPDFPALWAELVDTRRLATG